MIKSSQQVRLSFRLDLTKSDATLNRKYFQREQEKGCVRTGTYESKIYSLARFSGKIYRGQYAA